VICKIENQNFPIDLTMTENCSRSSGLETYLLAERRNFRSQQLFLALVTHPTPGIDDWNKNLSPELKCSLYGQATLRRYGTIERFP